MPSNDTNCSNALKASRIPTLHSRYRKYDLRGMPKIEPTMTAQGQFDDGIPVKKPGSSLAVRMRAGQTGDQCPGSSPGGDEQVTDGMVTTDG